MDEKQDSPDEQFVDEHGKVHARKVRPAFLLRNNVIFLFTCVLKCGEKFPCSITLSGHLGSRLKT